MADARFPRHTRRAFMCMGAAAAALIAASPALAKSAKVAEKDVIVETPDGKADAALFTPAGKGPWPAVILWHDLGGLRPVIRDMAKKLAAEGYVVLAPNEYYRSTRGSAAEPDLRNADVRKSFTDYRAAVPDDGVARDATAFVAWLDKQKGVALKKKIGTVGYDVGGSFAFRAAAALPDRIGAVASIHGQGVATTRPNSPHLRVPKSKAAYYVVQSKDDDAREPTDKDDYYKAFADGGLKGSVEVATGNHGFAVVGNANYEAASAEKAWAGTLALLKAALK